MTEFLIGLIGALIGAVLGFISSSLALRLGYHQLFAETVSKNRSEWINAFRANISKFLACSEMLYKSGDTLPNCYAYEKEMLEARALIITSLNTKEPEHRLMYGALTAINYSPENTKFYEQQVCILELAQKILKPEWERVKSEAKGKKNKKKICEN